MTCSTILCLVWLMRLDCDECWKAKNQSQKSFLQKEDQGEPTEETPDTCQEGRGRLFRRMLQKLENWQHHGWWKRHWGMIWAQLEGFKNFCRLSTFFNDDQNQRFHLKYLFICHSKVSNTTAWIKILKDHNFLFVCFFSSTAVTVRIYLEVMTVSWRTALSWQSSTLQNKTRDGAIPNLQATQMLWRLPTSAVCCNLNRKFVRTPYWTPMETNPSRIYLPVSASFRSKSLRMQRGEDCRRAIKPPHLKTLIELAWKVIVGGAVDIPTYAGAWWMS